jgi:hypothetical protein
MFDGDFDAGQTAPKTGRDPSRSLVTGSFQGLYKFELPVPRVVLSAVMYLDYAYSKSSSWMSAASPFSNSTVYTTPG